MAKKLKLHPEAEKELNSAFDWHNKNRENSGDKFVNQVDDKLQKILNKPDSHSADKDGFRWASVAKFPYHIIYFVSYPVIWIIAIWHNKREPGAWKKRKDDIGS